MQRLLTALSALGSGLLLAVACSEDRTGNLFSDPDAGSIRSLPGNGGSGGSANGGQGGSAGSAGVGGLAGLAGSGGDAGGGSMPAGSGGQDAGGVAPACSSDADCDDQNACTTERCQDGVCLDTGFAVLGAACGSNTDNPCTAPDTCGGGGMPGVCGHPMCTPRTCQSAGANCGALGDGCGGVLDCGQCLPPQTCGGGGIANVCGSIG